MRIDVVFNGINLTDYYVYSHRTLDTGEIFYIGVGNNQRGFVSHTRNELWEEIASKHGVEVIIEASGFKDRNEAVKEEVRLQQIHKPRACIVYGHRSQAIIPDSTREKLSKIHKGRKVSPETRKKLSESKLGDKNPMKNRTGDKNHMYGKTHSKEAREKISKGNKEFYEKHGSKRSLRNNPVINCRGEVFKSMKEACQVFNLKAINSIWNSIFKGKAAGAYEDGTAAYWKYLEDKGEQ